MAYRSMTFATFGVVIERYISPVFVTLYNALDAFFRAVMQVTSPLDWRSASDFGVAAYRKIADLKPVYRASYDTHGLSIDHRMRT